MLSIGSREIKLVKNMTSLSKVKKSSINLKIQLLDLSKTKKLERTSHVLLQ